MEIDKKELIQGVSCSKLFFLLAFIYCQKKCSIEKQTVLDYVQTRKLGM